MPTLALVRVLGSTIAGKLSSAWADLIAGKTWPTPISHSLRDLRGFLIPEFGYLEGAWVYLPN